MKKVLCEVYSRITGYMRPTMAWGPGKRQEFKDRKMYEIPDMTRRQVAADSLAVAESRKAAQHD